MKKKQYIRVKLYDVPVKDKTRYAEQKDKEARLYALAEKLHVKIGGKADT